MLVLQSRVPEFEGKCTPVSVNKNSGFFKLVRPSRLAPWAYVARGMEFHGTIRNGEVWSAPQHG